MPGLPERCDDFRCDLVDYATGETTFLTKEKQRALFDHLRKCPKCLEDLFDYEDIYTLAAALEHTRRPEFRAKMDALIKRFKEETPAVGPMSKIIMAAAEVSRHLTPGTRLGLADLGARTKLPPDRLHQAIGWLACKERIDFTEKGRNTYVQMR